MRSILKMVSAAALALTLAGGALATPIDTYEFQNPDNQKRAITLASELRCPQCQNQNLVDSNSPVARDLRLEVYKMVDDGKTDDEIVDFMTTRYGEFVLYKPKFEYKTLVLWGGPVALFLIGLTIVFMFVRRQRGNVTKEVALSEEDQRQLDELLKRNQQK
ncbi:heme lyase NrfEFG subunit NrfF [Shewanella corallii]|uniref:Formate-dependent nitrite reductase complex subunit n=2 Tax=Shewanella corallii TaxID=560080 RepID=A0ABT0NEM5_9GAMM|nr:heme lyase NrfEFG subunit NrfF [Shewanella corallii]MCL2916580.1 heme lyase NrfEFG subunit NrfF [Shewanella corallii]